jgi:hypothetical protein
MPEPPPPRKSRFLWLALLAWIAALGLAFRWVWPEGYSPFQSEVSSRVDALDEPPRAAHVSDSISPAPSMETAPGAAPPTSNDAPDTNGRAARDETTPPPASVAQGPTPRRATDLPDCETFLGEAKAAGYGKLPTHIGLSALDAFVGSTQWTKPCQGRRRRSVELCAAIRDGSLVGLTLHAKPVDLTLEECVREAALKLTFRVEPEVRIYRAELNL